MKTWILEKPGGTLSLQDIPTPEICPGCVPVEMQAVPLSVPYGNVLRNNWEIIGNFMYRPETFRVLMSLIRAGKIDFAKINTSKFDLTDLDRAIDAATAMRGLDCVVVTMGSEGSI